MDSLVAVAIHDAKNSLNALGVWLAAARREHAAKGLDESSPALERATEITARLTAQLVELLALYRAGEGTLRMAVEDHDLADFLADMISELGHSDSADAPIVIETDFAAATKLGEWAFDAYLVKFVLLDALRNALRHARQTIRFSLVQDSGPGIRFSIEDDGDGFPADVLRNSDGEQTASAAAMNAGSSGLGLSFAHLIAQRHAVPGGRHGSLELANDGLGKGGARFTLVLP